MLVTLLLAVLIVLIIIFTVMLGEEEEIKDIETVINIDDEFIDDGFSDEF